MRQRPGWRPPLLQSNPIAAIQIHWVYSSTECVPLWLLLCVDGREQPLSHRTVEIRQRRNHVVYNVIQFEEVLVAFVDFPGDERYGTGPLSPSEEARFWAECRTAAELQTRKPSMCPRHATRFAGASPTSATDCARPNTPTRRCATCCGRPAIAACGSGGSRTLGPAPASDSPSTSRRRSASVTCCPRCCGGSHRPAGTAGTRRRRASPRRRRSC